MFNLGVITTVKGIEIEIDGNFKTILIGLYKSLRINTITHSGDAPETSVNNEKRKLDTITRTDDTPETSDSNKKRKLDTITHSGDAPETSVNSKYKLQVTCT
ncbi:uncharacterized protein LOC115032982 [Acyrthosiphon pisum]|uniref:Uncharacterized protein n=1 Tax=Acyrthosiphon pisum TaxID=7029 RepID=A0A8R2JWH0_ACYPI|nr:uncharacterized protein LOC115032982 [Acyrthosiphon pisum]